jgi:DNA-binding LytR/AlgR family response regulator
MKNNCLIIDDEPLASNVIKSHLKIFKDFNVLAICQDALEAYSYLTNNKNPKVDLMFLDINMPEISGIDLLKTLDHKPLTVITTAYREFAVEGFELDVFDYLVKPIAFNRFAKTINKIEQHFDLVNTHTTTVPENEDDYLFVKVDKKMVKVYFSDILYIESLKDYVRIVSTTENLITHSNIGNFTANLPSEKFVRIHRSYTVALARINAVEGNNVIIGNKIIPIGRNYQTEIKKLILKPAV